MNQLTSIFNNVLPYVTVIAIVFVAVYPTIKQRNPSIAEKTEWLYKLAQSLVINQNTNDAPGKEKKAEATKQLLEQAKASKTKLTKSAAEAMIENAYNSNVNSQKDSNQISDLQGFAEEDDETDQLTNNMANEPDDAEENGADKDGTVA
ncbi:phage holin, LLH family [Lactobacillus apis]|uniref:phage holin, LLH family n=1 Tax=Lactobacillus apis TaxID=303541 RepID=UPI00242E58D0|nr:phage holin, LLH family [Lactobacillus apis]